MRKILAQGVGTISTPGKLNSEKSFFRYFVVADSSPIGPYGSIWSIWTTIWGSIQVLRPVYKVASFFFAKNDIPEFLKLIC